ncbi:putative S-adenosyl-L-methionine-dependent RNA methyltransferase RSM22, mitochondrial [Fulvia fulva]|nr:putative S-adenosyl-L-methionine-dependent RNA methyltransferase RSM22, mitochondrial [Fulvia fulva]WPV37454.1 putative S-adenosyl-L-methionine-dependent RNA methyltransferase RSM22, mitochondrial [Fulvia fulva]
MFTSSCATCRLRSLIRTKEVARRRRTAQYVARPLAAFRPFTTSPSRQRRGLVPTRAAPTASPKLVPFTRRQEVSLLESLYTSGSITREEWRESVVVQAGLKDEEQGTEERVRRLREWYSGDIVPGVLLEEEEVRVYERLFGKAREFEVGVEQEEGDVEEQAGTGVLREGTEGVLEEVEFDEELDIEDEEDVTRRRSSGNERLADDIRAAMEGEQESERDEVAEGDDGQDAFLRTHPLSIANRFATSPATLQLPKLPFIDPVTAMLSGISNTHLNETAHRVFGGPGLPYSTSTPTRGRAMPQKPIALDAYQGQMAEIEADVYMSTIMPGMYSSIISTLTETRKRLGTAWAEDMVRKAEAGELRILDAGGSGAGVLAVREMLRAEWERMHEDGHGDESPMALAELDGKAGGESAMPPMGSATVLSGSDTLRKRASKLLDNTTFVPRLPDYVHTEVAKQHGKFDIVIAPHTLWPLKEDYIRKTHVQNLWSLLSNNGGILLLLEKGVARGFELIAGARDMLLDSRIASPDSLSRQRDITEPIQKDLEVEWENLTSVPKETGMIIAPCTNHSSCPMYTQKGLVKGRRDICAFEQRYHRPQFLQTIFGTKGRNHENVEFSYISVMRGRDLRKTTTSTIEQTPEARDAAFKGYEASTQDPHSLSLPRTILPPIKRKGHVILDLCTPAGKLERWTVPRSFSKQAYRDARKSQWGDLWAMGAKTSIPRTPTIKRNRLDPEYADLDVKSVKGDGQKARSEQAKWEKREARRGRGTAGGLSTDEYGRVVVGGERVGVAGEVLNGGKRRGGIKVKGIRDKRDKRGDGNGRRKNLD